MSTVDRLLREEPEGELRVRLLPRRDDCVHRFQVALIRPDSELVVFREGRLTHRDEENGRTLEQAIERKAKELLAEERA